MKDKMIYKRKREKGKANNFSDKVEPEGKWKKSGEIETSTNTENSGNPVNAM